jgi:hypothetical protein
MEFVCLFGTLSGKRGRDLFDKLISASVAIH